VVLEEGKEVWVPGDDWRVVVGSGQMAAGEERRVRSEEYRTGGWQERQVERSFEVGYVDFGGYRLDVVVFGDGMEGVEGCGKVLKTPGRFGDASCNTM
jgi:hypothetical protein